MRPDISALQTLFYPARTRPTTILNRSRQTCSSDLFVHSNHFDHFWSANDGREKWICMDIIITSKYRFIRDVMSFHWLWSFCVDIQHAWPSRPWLTPLVLSLYGLWESQCSHKGFTYSQGSGSTYASSSRHISLRWFSYTHHNRCKNSASLSTSTQTSMSTAGCAKDLQTTGRVQKGAPSCATPPSFSPDLLSLVLTIPSHWALQPFLGTSKFACQNPHTCSFWRRYKEIWNWLRSLFRNTKSHLKNKAININKKTSTC